MTKELRCVIIYNEILLCARGAAARHKVLKNRRLAVIPHKYSNDIKYDGSRQSVRTYYRENAHGGA